jgi:hypothetical protein
VARRRPRRLRADRAPLGEPGRAAGARRRRRPRRPRRAGVTGRRPPVTGPPPGPVPALRVGPGRRRGGRPRRTPPRGQPGRVDRLRRPGVGHLDAGRLRHGLSRLGPPPAAVDRHRRRGAAGDLGPRRRRQRCVVAVPAGRRHRAVAAGLGSCRTGAARRVRGALRCRRRRPGWHLARATRAPVPTRRPDPLRRHPPGPSYGDRPAPPAHPGAGPHQSLAASPPAPGIRAVAGHGPRHPVGLALAGQPSGPPRRGRRRRRGRDPHGSSLRAAPCSSAPSISPSRWGRRSTTRAAATPCPCPSG